MKKSAALLVLAWVLVPLVFITYTIFSYSIALQKGALPFLQGNQIKWWLAFLLTILLGSVCFYAANDRKGFQRILFPLLYVVVMTAILLGVFFFTACGFGDCL